MNHFVKKNRFWILGVAVFLSGFMLGGGPLGGPLQKEPVVSNETYKKLKVFQDVLAYVVKQYVEEVNVEDLFNGAIKGMLNTLDPHTTYLPPDLFKELQVETKGSFHGIGIQIEKPKETGIITVVAPIEGTPAYRAGIKSGDEIIKVDGALTKNMTLMEAVKKMRGPRGTKVIITIKRKGWSELKDFTLIRDVIPIRTVKYKILEPGYGYIKISHFNEETDKDLKEGLNALELEKGGLKGLILDLRNNPGGLLNEAIKVADNFVDSGLIVYTKGRGEQQQYSATKEGTYTEFPMITLINWGSASASEIVAGALQDHRRSVILGTTTFGKASVQTLLPLEDGSGLKLTVALYYTPNGHSIQAKGITPDIIVEPSGQKKLEMGKKHFIKEEDLERHIENKKENKGAEEESEKEELKEDKTAEIKGDPQLEQALNLLKSWDVFRDVAIMSKKK